MQQRIENQNVPSSVWLNEHGAFVDYTSIANAPSKDFYQVFVTPKEVNRSKSNPQSEEIQNNAQINLSTAYFMHTINKT